MDSEGYLTAYYSDQTSEGIGHIPSGPQGEPGQNGKIIDVLVNGQSVVTSEGIAYVNASSEGMIYEAGENITIDGNVINAVDTTYTAGENIYIDPNNVISATVDDLLGRDLLVTKDVGYYYAGDIITADTPLRDIIRNMLYQETPPTPPQTDKWCFGAFNDPPTSMEGMWSMEDIDGSEVARTGKVQYFTTNRQYASIAYPQSMGPLVNIIESDFLAVLDNWTRVETVYNGVPYYIYYNIKTKSNNIKEEFKWR